MTHLKSLNVTDKPNSTRVMGKIVGWRREFLQMPKRERRVKKSEVELRREFDSSFVARFRANFVGTKLLEEEDLYGFLYWLEMQLSAADIKCLAG